MYVFSKVNYPIVCSYAIADEYINNLGIRVRVIQNGVNTNYFNPKIFKNIVDRDSTFIVSGSLIPRKNVKYLIEVFKKFPNFKLLIVGGGLEKNHLVKFAEGYSNIVFLGQVNDVRYFLNKSKFIISSSFSEGLPNSILEGMSWDLIPVLSKIKPHLEVTKGLKNKFLFDPLDFNSLSEQLKIIEKSNHLESQSREFIINHFSMEIMSSKYQEIYESVKNA